MTFRYQTFYHLNSELLVHCSRHGLNNGPFDKQTVLDHLNSKLVCYSDPYCITAKCKLLLPSLVFNLHCQDGEKSRQGDFTEGRKMTYQNLSAKKTILNSIWLIPVGFSAKKPVVNYGTILPNSPPPPHSGKNEFYAFHSSSLFITIQGLFLDQILFDWA